MVGDLPPAPREGPTTGPPPGSAQWPSAFPMQPPPRPRAWPAMLLTGVATVVAIAALIVSLTQRAATKPTTPSTPTSSKPTYSAAETSAAQRQLCDTYSLAARAVGVDTNGNNPALARTALTNAASMLDSVDADPALDSKHRDAARALATAYRTLTAKSSSDAFTEAEYRAALDDVGAKDDAMKKVCGLG